MKNEFGPSRIQANDPLNIFKYNQQEDYKYVDFSLLIRMFYKKIWLVLSLVAFSILLAIGAAYYLTPGYKVTTVLTEPDFNQYQDLYLNTDSNITQSELLNLFLKKLANHQNFNSFLQQSDLINKINQDIAPANAKSLKTSFIPQNYKLKVLINQNKGLSLDNQNNRFGKITNDGIDAQLIIYSSMKESNADLSKAYINFTNTQFLNEFAQKQRDIIKIRINKLEQEISVQIAIIKNQLSFKIEKLKHQIELIKSKSDISRFKESLSNLEEKLTNAEYNLQILTSENNSTNKDFLKKVIELQQLKGLSFDLSKIRSYNIDSSPKIEKNAPNIKLMAMLGVFFGLIFSALIIFLQINFNMRRELKPSIQTNNYAMGTM